MQKFEFKLEDNIFQLYEEIKNKTYYHSLYCPFYIRDPKIRLIHKATVRDRIVHHVLCQYLNRIFEPIFIDNSYSCRENKGTHRAINRLQNFLIEEYKTHGSCWVLKCDIKKFFASIVHSILLSLIEGEVKNKEILWLVNNIVKSFTTRPNLRESKGCPIGNLTSQLLDRKSVV